MLLLPAAPVIGALVGLAAGLLARWIDGYDHYVFPLCAAGAGGLIGQLVTRFHERRLWLAGLAGGIAGLLCYFVGVALAGTLAHGFTWALFLKRDLPANAISLPFCPILGCIMAGQAARKPYCEQCSSWAQVWDKRHVSKDALGAAKQLIRDGDWEGLLRLPQTSDNVDPLLTFYLCPQCEQGFLTFQPDRYQSHVVRYPLDKAATELLKRQF